MSNETGEGLLLTHLLTLEKRIFSRLRVSILGIVESIDLERRVATVQPIPKFIYPDGEERTYSHIEVRWIKYPQLFEEQDLYFMVGDVVLIVFTDFDSRYNLDQLKQGIEEVTTSMSKEMHSSKNGIIIGVLDV